MKELLKILEEVKTKLSGFAKEKLDISLSKNSDLYKFTSKNNSMDHQIKTLYAPLISVEVERSFSIYKTILTDRRISLLEPNIEKLLVIKFNSFLN